MRRLSNKSIYNFTYDHRVHLLLTLLFVLIFALVFASVTTADYEPSETVEASSESHVRMSDGCLCFVESDGVRSAYTINTKLRVADLLKAAGVTLDENDFSVPALDEQVKDKMTVKITRVNTCTLVDEATIPYKTIRIDDPELFVGSEVTETEGMNGIAAVTYSLVFQNGIEVSREEIKEECLLAPVDEIIRHGTKPFDAAWDADGAHCDPATFIVSDVPAEEGGGVITLADGTVLNYKTVVPVSATAYTTERQSFKITYTGTVAHVGGIAVDPRVIPLGTRMYVVAEDGTWTYGYAKAEDIGGGIKGNRIDLFYDTYNECIYFGVRRALVYIIDD